MLSWNEEMAKGVGFNRETHFKSQNDRMKSGHLSGVRTEG